MSLISDQFRDVVEWDGTGDTGYDSSWTSEASVSAPDLLQTLTGHGNDISAQLDSKPDMEAEGEKPSAPQSLSAMFKNKAMDMKPVQKLDANKATKSNPKDVINQATNKVNLAQQNLKEMAANHKDMQNGQAPDADTQSKGGGVSEFVADTGKGIAAAAFADTIVPGSGPVVAAATTIAQGFKGAGSMITHAQGGELSKPVASKTVKGKPVQEDVGYGRSEIASSDVMAGGSKMQNTLNNLSNIPGLKTPNFDLGSAKCTHDHLEGISKVPFKETPEAQATLAALSDGVEATSDYLHRIDKGVDANQGLDIAMSKGLPADGSAGDAVLNNENGLKELAGGKPAPLNGALI